MPDSASWISAVATGVGAASAIVYTVISLKLWEETRKQAKATEDQLKLTEKQFSMTEAAYRAAYRPILGLAVSIAIPQDATLLNRRIQITYELTNYGQVPIFDLKTIVTDSHFAYSKDIYWGNIFPKQTASSCSLPSLSRDQAKSWTDQIEAHTGSLSFAISVVSFAANNGERDVVFSNNVEAKLEENVEPYIRSLSVND
jgi:hypothetical protein